ncbi:MAG: thioesterase [Flavobacterium sp. BFFFF2]|nr:MAG: thioesterase [Flavobacterium sp. BFFFF2]
MNFSPSTINRFLLFKLPAAFFCGVRVKTLADDFCEVHVTFRWINQNPFGSMYFAVLNMAAELTTGVLVMRALSETGTRASMLVIGQQTHFLKKATGTITFKCEQQQLVADCLKALSLSKDPQTLTLESEGYNEQGELVARSEFYWSLKQRA